MFQSPDECLSMINVTLLPCDIQILADNENDPENFDKEEFLKVLQGLRFKFKRTTFD
jgi:hypothetical protein